MNSHNKRHSSTESPLDNTDELVQRVMACLKVRLGNPVSNFQMSRRDDGLILRGAVRTYYAKQMIQEAVTEVSGQLIVANDIEIHGCMRSRHGNVYAK